MLSITVWYFLYCWCCKWSRNERVIKYRTKRLWLTRNRTWNPCNSSQELIIMSLLVYPGWFPHVVNKAPTTTKAFLHVFHYWCKLKTRWIDYLHNDKMIFPFARVKQYKQVLLCIENNCCRVLCIAKFWSKSGRAYYTMGTKF